MTSFINRVIAVVAALAGALFLSSCNTASDGRVDHEPTDEPVITGEPAGYNADDVAFATNMIPHHQQAVELSALVPDRTTDPEVIAMASQISAAQQPEIEIMKVLLVQWKEGTADTPSSHSGHSSTMQGMVDEATMTQLESLNGTEFDTLWLESMISHHQGAIEMANAEIANGENVDAKGLAQSIIDVQRAEIGQMKQMLGSG